MRPKLLALMLLVTSAPVWSGQIADQFGSGYEGIRWGLPLADLVGMMPEGDQYFSVTPGQRDYAVTNGAPLLGVPRLGSKVRYFFDKEGGVQSIAVGIPYDRYQQLLGILISQFGRYSQIVEVGAIRYYIWQQDEQIRIGLAVTKDPRYGIAQFGINHVSNSSSRAGPK